MNETYQKNSPASRAPSFLDSVVDRLLPARKEKKELQEQYDQLEAFSQSIPLEYCGWNALTGTHAVSEGFGELLGLKNPVTRFEDIKSAFANDEANALEKLFENLENKGREFDAILTTRTNKKSLKIMGKKGARLDGTDGFSVLWVIDVTPYAQATKEALNVAQRIEKKELQMRATLGALPIPVWMRHAETLDIVWCNKSYTSVVDETAATVIADQKELPVKSLQLMDGDKKKDISQRLMAQRALAKTEQQEAKGYVIVEGARRLMKVVEMPLPSENTVMGFALDMTREEDLEKSYERLAQSHREGMEQLRTAIAMFDADMRLEFYNAAYEQMTGMSGTFLDTNPRITEVIDKLRELRKIPEQADFKQFKQQWVNRFTALIESYEEMQYLPDGSMVRMVVMPRPMGGIFLTQEDVTSRMELETSYNTLIAVQEETMNNLVEGVAVFGEDGRLRLSNQSYARIWNIDEDDLSGEPHITRVLDRMGAFFGASEWVDMRDVMLSNALEREPRRGRIHRNDGSVLEYSVMPLPDGNILNAWIDVTDTVHVEEALIEKNEALEAAEKLKTDFLANVSYQLRTPLNAIMGFSEMLHQQFVGKLNERQLEYTENMISAGKRLISLINDILDLSTIDAGYLKLYPEQIRMQSLIRQVTDLTEDWARKQGVTLHYDCDNDIAIYADERRVKQVFLNLISNAINYSPNGGDIQITVSDQGADHIIIEVKDEGMGIPADELDRVFTPFEQIKDKTAKRRSGAGLGLALVKSIVTLHGGDVRIVSAEGQGTTVSFTLKKDIRNDISGDGTVKEIKNIR